MKMIPCRGNVNFSALAVQLNQKVYGDCVVSTQIEGERSCSLRRLHLPLIRMGEFIEFDVLASYEDIRYDPLGFPSFKREGKPLQGKRGGILEEILGELGPRLREQLKRATPLGREADHRGRTPMSYCRILYDAKICDLFNQEEVKGWKVSGKFKVTSSPP